MVSPGSSSSDLQILQATVYKESVHIWEKEPIWTWQCVWIGWGQLLLVLVEGAYWELLELWVACQDIPKVPQPVLSTLSSSSAAHTRVKVRVHPWRGQRSSDLALHLNMARATIAGTHGVGRSGAVWSSGWHAGTVLVHVPAHTCAWPVPLWGRVPLLKGHKRYLEKNSSDPNLRASSPAPWAPSPPLMRWWWPLSIAEAPAHTWHWI